METIFAAINQYKLINWAFLFFTIFFFISVYVDRRRFRNAIYLQAWILTGVFLLIYNFKDSVALLILYLIAGIFLIFLLWIVPILLIINGFIVVKREGFSLSNLLALFFAIFIISGEFASILSVLHNSRQNPLWLGSVELLFGITVFYVSMVFLAFMFYSIFVRWIPRKSQFNYVIVLGSGLINGERVSKLLAQRIDKGIKVYQKSGHTCKIIMSGGQGPDEKISEAQAMKKYAVANGVLEKDILLEDTSTNTMENLHNSQKILQEREGKHDTAVVTSQYHVLRVNVYAKYLQFPITGISAPTASYYWPTAMTREYAGLVKYYWKTYVFFYLITLLPLIIAIIYSAKEI